MAVDREESYTSKKSFWRNKKYGKRFYASFYEISGGEREFVLKSGVLRNGRVHRIVFESHEAAKFAGWSKVK